MFKKETQNTQEQKTFNKERAFDKKPFIKKGNFNKEKRQINIPEGVLTFFRLTNRELINGASIVPTDLIKTDKQRVSVGDLYPKGQLELAFIRFKNRKGEMVNIKLKGNHSVFNYRGYFHVVQLFYNAKTKKLQMLLDGPLKAEIVHNFIDIGLVLNKSTYNGYFKIEEKHSVRGDEENPNNGRKSKYDKVLQLTVNDEIMDKINTVRIENGLTHRSHAIRYMLQSVEIK